VPQDYAEAMKWFRKAADQGDTGAQSNLGFMYAKGQGVPEDYVEAMKWFRMAADQGDTGAGVELFIEEEIVGVDCVELLAGVDRRAGTEHRRLSRPACTGKSSTCS
jgi:TPR repeat protein